MSAYEAYVAAFRDVWSHAWESVSSVLEGVSEDEARWQAPAYADTEQEAGWPPEGTILWHIAHLAHCKRYYAAILEHRDEASPPEVEERTPLGTLAEELAALAEAQDAQLAALVACDGADWSAPAAGKMPLGEFVAMTTRHDAWHGGQIAMLRRLHRAETGTDA